MSGSLGEKLSAEFVLVFIEVARLFVVVSCWWLICSEMPLPLIPGPPVNLFVYFSFMAVSVEILAGLISVLKPL